MGCRWQGWAPVSGWFFPWRAGDMEGLKSLFNMAVLRMRVFTSTGVWNTACGAAWSLPLENGGCKGWKKPWGCFLHSFMLSCPCRKIFSFYSQVGVHGIFLSLSPPCHCQVPKAPGAVSSPHDAREPGPWAGSAEPWDKPSLRRSPGPWLPVPSLRLSVEMMCCPLVLLSLSINQQCQLTSKTRWRVNDFKQRL